MTMNTGISTIQVIQGDIIEVNSHQQLFSLNILCAESNFLLSINTTSDIHGIINIFKKDMDDIYKFCSSVHIGFNPNSLAIVSKSISKINLNGDNNQQIINAFDSLYGVEIELEV